MTWHNEPLLHPMVNTSLPHADACFISFKIVSLDYMIW